MAISSRGSVVYAATINFAIALLIAILGPSPVEAAVGRTKGSFVVSPSGAATYTIPIFTPPGPRGMQPSIALAYSSSAGTGYLGVGWSLQGLSAIGRCNKTVAQDGVAGRINLSLNDRFCLNGNRLRLQSGTYGSNGSVWATELADFSRITANGTTNSGAGGPQSWTVERKDGTTYTYGGTADSAVTLGSSGVVGSWLVSQIQDRAGNKIKFTYKVPDSTTEGTTHPVKIEWTQSSAGSGSYVYSMEFDYTSNSLFSSITGFVVGHAVRDIDLLTSISVKNSGTTVRKYVLAYQASPTTGANRLHTVTECSDAGQTDCLASTTIGYQDGQIGVATSASATFSSASPNYFQSWDGSYDYNGDGKKDLTYKKGASWYVRLAQSGGSYGSEISVGNTGPAPSYTFSGGDPFGNGRDVMLTVSGTTWHAFTFNGSSFTAVNLGITWAIDNLNFIDVNGDGREDVVGVGYVWLSTSTGSTLSFASEAYFDIPTSDIPPDAFFYGAEIAPPKGPHFAQKMDIDSDGREDFVLWVMYWADFWDEYGNYLGSGIDGNGYIMRAEDNSQFTAFLDNNGGQQSAHANDDNCVDHYSFEAVRRSLCNGSVTSTSTAGWSDGVLDWNSDGRKDVLIRPGSGSNVRLVQLSTGEGLTSASATSIPYSGCPPSACGSHTFTTDVDGDGLDDLGLLIWSGQSSNTIYVYPHNGAFMKPDLAVSFTDGFGVNHSVSYTISTDQGYTAYTNASYPQQDVNEPRVLARTVTSTDGTGGTYTTTYSYFGATQDLHGRGWLGFEKIESVDSRTSIKNVRRFERGFPYTGMLVEKSVYQPGGTPISMKTVTPLSATLDATAYNQRHFPYVGDTTEDVYEVGGTSDGSWITRTAITNTYDNFGNLTASTNTITDKDVSSPLYTHAWVSSTSTSFLPNTTFWCLGLPASTSVTLSTTTGEASVARSKSFTPDYVNCRLDAESTEPSSSTLRVDTSYGYDGFGNVSSVTITGRNSNGSNMGARTSSMSWGTTGQFPMSETNALSQTTTRVFHSTFGSLVSETDPNGIVVASNEFDAFGRATRSVRADGTATRTTYAACETYSCENGDPGSGVTGINKVIVVASERDSSDAQFRDSMVYLDQFDRPIVQKTMTISGSYSRSGTQYDALGRVYRQTAPCDASMCAAYWVTNSYDLVGRTSSQTRPQSQGNSTPVTTAFAYAGRFQSITDPSGKNSTKIHDVNGWMRRSTDHDGYSQTFAYDAAGSLKQVTDSLSNTLFSASYSYGIKAFQIATTDMDLGTWSYTYNSLGELVGWTDAKSQSFIQTYDALSRMTSRTEAEGTATWTWGSSAAYHNIGKLYEVSQSGYVEGFDYDNKGRMTVRAVTTDQTYYFDYSYNNQGLLDTLTYPTSTSGTRVKIKQAYDFGILKAVTDWTSGSAGVTFWTANSQNARGQTTQEALGNGVITNRNFDAVTGWLNSIQSGGGGGTGLQNQSYLYDVVGNVTQRQENTLGLTENFYYDNLYRLDYSQLGGVTNLNVTYDAMGNITNRTDVNSNATWNYHGTKKHAVASTGSGGLSYSYDANGNMTNRGGSTITWASYNYPTSMATGTESTTFYYGPDRQYYRQDYEGPSSSETTFYVGGLLEKVCPSSVCASGTIDWRHYIKAEGQTVAIVSRKSSGSNAVNYPLEDNQGSSSVLTSSSGTNLARVSFNAFGLARDGNDWDGAVPSGDLTTIEGISRRGYTDHSMLGRMGLIHMNGRVQDAITGRFLSPDVHVPDPGSTQSYNRYAYVKNNPLSFIDPTGFEDKRILVDGSLMYESRASQLYADKKHFAGIACGSYDYHSMCAAVRAELEAYEGAFLASQQEDQLTSLIRDIERSALEQSMRSAIANCGTISGGDGGTAARGGCYIAMDPNVSNETKAAIGFTGVAIMTGGSFYTLSPAAAAFFATGLELQALATDGVPLVGVGSAARGTATGFRGSKGAELANAPYQAVRNAPATINGRQYAGHALDQMQNRGFTPSVVENTLSVGAERAGNTAAEVRYFDSANNVSVVLDRASGRVVTVRNGD